MDTEKDICVIVMLIGMYCSYYPLRLNICMKDIKA
jgi:hypothetical protein